MSSRSIWAIDRTLLGATIQGQSGPKEALYILQSANIADALQFDCLVL